MAWRLRAFVAALAIPPALEILPFARLARALSVTRGAGPDLDDRALAAWVDAILTHLPWPWRRTCLRRATVLYGLLRRAGRPVELWIGVRQGERAGAAVTAHAWLRLGGAPYLEANPDHPGRHTPIAHFPDARA